MCYFVIFHTCCSYEGMAFFDIHFFVSNTPYLKKISGQRLQWVFKFCTGHDHFNIIF